MNKAILVGRLTKDPELKMTENTKREVCQFTIAENKKEIERLKRDKNLAEERLKILQRKYDKMEQRNTFLESRNKILELVESYLPHRINVISKMNDARYDYAILEIKKLSDALDTEKEKLENKGDGEDERE